MIKKFILSTAALFTALCFTSCFQQETTVHLKKNGSGTITVATSLVGPMFSQMTKEELKDSLVQGEKSAKKSAADYGQGVTFVKFEEIKGKKAFTTQATYAFADINTLKMQVTTGVNADATADVGSGEKVEEHNAEQKEALCSFRYKDGVLTIIPDKKFGASPADKAKPAAPQANEMPKEMEQAMNQMLADMKISIMLIPESGIAQTNATHRVGDTVTLMEFDANKVIKNPDFRKKLDGVDQENPTAMLQALKGIDGLKLETKPEVTVKLK